MDLNSADWEEELFTDSFVSISETFTNRIKNDPTFTLEELQKYLDLAYAIQDDSSAQRGRVMEIKGNARVAALEMVLSEWKAMIQE
ncbi:Uncharacterized protein QTN25_007307 [Entamoeba marina]